MPHMAREPFPAEYTQDLLKLAHGYSWHTTSPVKIIRWRISLKLQEKLDEILDYLRRVGGSGKKVEARKSC